MDCIPIHVSKISLGDSDCLSDCVLPNTREENETIVLGVGLSITKKLVELHGGSISVSSVKGSGTEVNVSLPVTA